METNMTKQNVITYQSASIDIWDSKYRLKTKDGVPIDDDIDATYKRVARAIADVEAYDQDLHYKNFLWALRNGAIPAGRIMSNAGALEHKPATSTINCLAGDTPVLTKNGIYPIRLLAENTKPVYVLNGNGRWVKVKFKSYGVQETVGIQFKGHNKKQLLTVRSTLNHRWILTDGKVITTEYWLTGDLNKRHTRIPNIFAPKATFKSKQFKEGLLHGLIYGDGCWSTFYKEKDEFNFQLDLIGQKETSFGQFVRDFTGIEPKFYDKSKGYYRYSQIKLEYNPKELPSRKVDKDYLAGFFAGVVGTDGTVPVTAGESKRRSSAISIYGNIKLVKYLETMMPTVGIIPVSLYSNRFTEPTNYGNRNIAISEITFNPSTISSKLILNQKHRKAFYVSEDCAKFSEYWTFKGSDEDYRFEEVFCCEEPETHSFVLANGLLTGNCTVSGTIMDSMDSILSNVHEAGLTLKSGCGIGYEFSTLRQKDAYVAGAGATTSGPLSFMDIFDKMCFTISSAGGRRGAQMATFDIAHPDVVDFIKAKREDGRLRQFNCSLLITSEFIEAVKTNSDWHLSFPVSEREWATEDIGDDKIVWRNLPNTEGYITNDANLVACKIASTINARDLWDIIMSSTYDYAEPGFILIDKVNEMNNNWFCENVRATNPCITGDTKIAVHDRGPVEIQQLAAEGLDVIVHCNDPGTGQSHLSIGRNPRKTGKQHKIYKVILSDGTYFKANAEHSLYTSEYQKVKISNWVIGTRVWNVSTMTQDDVVIESIQYCGSEDVYNITVDDFHTYCIVTDSWVDDNGLQWKGIVSANCGEQPLPPFGSCWTGSMRLNTDYGTLTTKEAFRIYEDTGNLKIAVDSKYSNAEKTEFRDCRIVKREGKREVFRIETHQGRVLEFTADHKFSTPYGWTEVGDLITGDEIHVQSSTNL